MILPTLHGGAFSVMQGGLAAEKTADRRSVPACAASGVLRLSEDQIHDGLRADAEEENEAHARVFQQPIPFLFIHDETSLSFIFVLDSFFYRKINLHFCNQPF